MKGGQNPTGTLKSISKTKTKSNTRTLVVMIDDEWIRSGTVPVSMIDQRAVKLLQSLELPVAILDGEELDTLFEPADGGVMMTDRKGRKVFLSFEMVFDDGND